MLIYHSFNASGSTFSRLHQHEAAISLRHLGKSILEGNIYLLTTFSEINIRGISILRSFRNVTKCSMPLQYLYFHLSFSDTFLIQNLKSFKRKATMKISEIRITILKVICNHTVFLSQMNKGSPLLLCHSFKTGRLYLFGIVFKTSGVTTAGSLYSFGKVVPLMYFVQRKMTLEKPFQRIKRCLTVFPREPLSCVLVSINVTSCRRTECSCVLHDANKINLSPL